MPSYLKPALLLLLAGLTVAAVGNFLRLDADARQNVPRAGAAPKGGRYVNVGDCDLFIQEMGGHRIDDPVMLFVGGRGEWSENWREWAALATNFNFFHTVALDLPPFGFSTRPARGYSRAEQADRFTKLVEKLGAHTLVIVASGIGAAPALTAAGLMPDKVVSVLLIAPDIELENARSPVTQVLLGNSFLRSAISSLVTNPKLQRLLLSRELYRENVATETAAATYAKPLNLEGTSEEVGRWLQASDPMPYEDFPTAAAVTIFEGDHGRGLSARLNSILRPPTELRELKGVGNLPQLEDPEQFRAAFSVYLAELEHIFIQVEPTEP